MKSICKIFFFCLSLFVCSCSSDSQLQELSNVANDEITKMTAILPNWDIDEGYSRTSITTGSYPTAPNPVWVTGDSIGIYPDEGDQLSFRISEGGGKTCSFDGGGWAMKASSSYSAYSPFNRGYYYKEKNALPISMLGQKQNGNDNSDHLGAYDIQVAKGDKPEQGSLTFSFERKVALVRIELTAPKAATWTSVSLESDAFFTIDAFLNLSLTNPTLTSSKTANSVTLSLTNVVTTSENLNIIAYMMLLPIDLTGKTLSVKLTDSEGNVYKKNASIVNDRTNFAANSARWITADFYIPYLTFKASDAQTFKLSSIVASLEYSINNNKWVELGDNTVTFGGEYGDLQLRGKSSTGTCYEYPSIIRFGSNNVKVSCSGDIRTLIDYENYKTTDTRHANFRSLFSGCINLVTPPELPATTLATSCYESMFRNCTSLNEAPALPATILVGLCYKSMFENCTNLTVAPALPALELATACYSNMFKGCENLVKAPELLATTLATSCYESMFRNCTSLNEAPALPATQLILPYCYRSMFENCTSLTIAPTLPATILSNYCYEGMFKGCTSLKVAPTLPATTLTRDCYFAMFEDCVNLVTAPTLPAQNLASSCYYRMFKGCKNLEKAPVLPASKLASYCYHSMFFDCINLKSITILATDISASYCLFDWVYNVSSNGIFTKSSIMETLPFGSSGIPKGWTINNYY